MSFTEMVNGLRSMGRVAQYRTAQWSLTRGRSVANMATASLVLERALKSAGVLKERIYDRETDERGNGQARKETADLCAAEIGRECRRLSSARTDEIRRRRRHKTQLAVHADGVERRSWTGSGYSEQQRA